jgi:hypothetical protein
MKKVLIFIIIMLVVYYTMFYMTETKLQYVTISFYTMSLLSSLSHLFMKI